MSTIDKHCVGAVVHEVEVWLMATLLLLACDAFDVSCKLISNLSCVVSTAPHHINI